MNPRAWAVAFRDAFKSMTGNPLMSIASTATVAVSLLVLSAVALLAINLQYMASTVEQQVEVHAYLCSPRVPSDKCPKTELKDDQKKAIVDQIAKLPGVKKATYVSRDQALEDLKKQFGEHKDILDDLDGDNPLRDEVKIQAVDTNNVKAIADAALKIQGVSDANWGQDYVDKLLAFTNAIRLAGTGLVLLLIVATVLTISNTIRLSVYARRREVSIMKLVGATDWYIRRPFMLEGVTLGVVGALAAMLITSWGYHRVAGYAYANLPFLPLKAPGDVLVLLTLALVALGGALGAFGSYVSLRRFLKV